MNQLLFFVVALSFVFTVAIAQSEEDSANISFENVVDSEIDSGIDMGTNTADAAIDTAIDTAAETADNLKEKATVQEDQLNKAINDMMTYFSKSNKDMSNMLAAIENANNNDSDIIRKNLVDNLMNYAEDTEIMMQQIHKVMNIRAQFQDSILKQLYSLPISSEDAEKLENNLREQMKLRANKIPNMQNMMDYPQQVSKFIPKKFRFISN